MGSIVGRKGKFFAAHFWDFAGPKKLLCEQVSQNCRDTVLKWGTFGEQNNQHPSPPFHSKSGCLQFSTGSSKSGTTFHGGDGGGKASFSLF